MHERAKLLAAVVFVALQWATGGSVAAQGLLDDAQGYVCPFPGGGAWASTTSFPGCKPSPNYRAAQQEVSRLNAAVDIGPRGRDLAIGTNNSATLPQPHAAGGKPIYKCVDPAGKVLYTDEPCGAANGQRQTPLPASRNPPTLRTDDGTEYDRAVQVIKARYPTLNPELPVFDRAAAGEVLTRMNRYISQGQSREAAVRIAADEVMGVTKPTAAPAQVPSQEPQRFVQGTKQRVDPFGMAILIVATLVALSLAWRLVRWLVSKFSSTAVRAAQIAGTVAASDAARSAGGVISSVGQKSGEVLDGLGRGMRNVKRHDKLPWE